MKAKNNSDKFVAKLFLGFIVYCGIGFYLVDYFVEMKIKAKDQETHTTAQDHEVQELPAPIMDPSLTGVIFLF